MPTPLLPPPTPLLSALPCPPPQAPTPSASGWHGWSPQPLSAVIPSLSSSAPAELPSFELEHSAIAAKRRASIKNSHRKSGKSILNSHANDDTNINNQSSVSLLAATHLTLPLPSLTAALQQQKINSDDLSIKTSSLTVKSSLSNNSTLSHSQSFSSGELTNMLGNSMKLPTAPILSSPSVSVAANDARMNNSSQSLLHNNNNNNNQQQQQRFSSIKSAMNSDQRSMSRLSKFSSLLQIVQSDHYVIVDLDDTVYCQYHTPCSMMTESGLQRYSSIINSHEKYKHLSFANKSSITRALQSAVSRKRGVENDTIATIKSMQLKGIPVFALTARFASMIATTRTELASLGLDFSLTSPFPSFVKDLSSSAVLCDGVLYSNAQEKGPILNRFLSQLFDQYSNNNLNNENNSPITPTLTSLSLAITPNNNNSSPILTSSKPILIPSTTTNSSSSILMNGLSSSLPSSNTSPIIFKTSKKLKYKKLKYKFSDSEEEINGKHLDVKGNGSNNHINNNNNNNNHNNMYNDNNNNSSSNEKLNVLSLPSKLIFIDDRLQNCVSVMNGCKIALTLNIGISCYHYTPIQEINNNDNNDNENDSEDDEEDDDGDNSMMNMTDNSDDDDNNIDNSYIRDLSDYQIHHFIQYQIVLRDHEAKKLRRMSRGASPTLKISNSSPLSNSLLNREDDEVNGIIGMI